MTDDKFDVMLDASDPDFAEQLMTALGVKPGDTVEFVTPQFHREDGVRVTYFPRTVREYDALGKLCDEAKLAVGMRRWDDGENGTLWLFPHEWYGFIPDSYEVTDIFWEVEPFKRGQTDDDTRFGVLAFGIVA